MIEDLKPYLETLSKEELIEIIMRLSADADRLRRELDDAQGVIR